jgi:hypothetical protein
MVVVQASRLNGIGMPVPMPLQTAILAFDDLGYPGWVAKVHTNPRNSLFSTLISLDEEGKWWQAFGQVVLEWNFADEQGQPIPLPRECESELDIDLPVGLISNLFRRYLEEVNTVAAVPKAPASNSDSTSPINASGQTNGKE